MPIPQNPTITLNQQSLRTRNINHIDNHNDNDNINTTRPFGSRQGPKQIRAQLPVTIQRHGNFKNSSLAALSSSWQPTRHHHSETTRPAMRCSALSIIPPQPRHDVFTITRPRAFFLYPCICPHKSLTNYPIVDPYSHINEAFIPRTWDGHMHPI
ncbi:hypothetical protein M441DRAFT_57062 [Trichoderma asperellum CBS 433.97]|uniref:Uncharacterized protein n=1 Tax=Trichoderma asperellum (strain ATCC 204424 / CBS 433.97 / NBRC 101777) TaxID=1042311 RepID=A0A2T3ZBU9_TRIA4|nr:hypothetical protein M441DRAFT_57062 [Trichoderma asperellum CBS 433.97]PTB42281.1 hypothetical protein M441DRAFT_57062 [Trichoderma asperellum CBS 433.97]